MDLFQAIAGRRSIRKYRATPVENTKVMEILRAGMMAPSAGNQQAWQFVVVDKREMLDGIMAVHPYSAMLKQAPMAIVVCGDQNHEKHKGYWVQDCSAAVQNMLLAAHALGLGSCWLGLHPREDRVAGVSKLLGLPNGVVPMAAVALGYADETHGPADRFDAAKVHANRW
jgi:nitroreductase